MAKKRRIESMTEFTFTVERFDDGLTRIEMKTKNVDFHDLINVTQYMMWQAASQIDMDFEEAIEELCDGARRFYPMLHVVKGTPEEGDQNER